MLNKTKSRITNRPLLQPSSDLVGNGDRHGSGGDGQGRGCAASTQRHRHGLQRLRLQELCPIDGTAVNHFEGDINENLK